MTRNVREPSSAHTGDPYEYDDWDDDEHEEDDLGDEQAFEFTESPAGYTARERWARSYDELNGAPEGDWDR